MARQKRTVSWRDGNWDSPEAARVRLEAAAADPVRRERVRWLVTEAHRIVQASPDYRAAVAARGRMGALDMCIRKFHDELGWDTRGTLCRGALYRSADAVMLAARGELTAANLHCEHTIPLACLARLAYQRGRGATVAELADLLLTGSVVTAMSRAERHGALVRMRACVPGGPVSDWRDTHPEISAGPDGSLLAAPGLRPFLRYVGTGIDVVYYPGGDGTPVDAATLTWEAHRQRARAFALFRWENYVGEAALAA